MKKIVVIIAIICFSFSTYSQEKESSNIKYSLIAESSLYGAIHHFGMDLNVVNGIILNKQHSIGLGMGLAIKYDSYEYIYYCPVYLNYRYYFYDSKYSPFANLALGCSIFEDGQGFYSALTAGFKKYNFSFSSGIFFQANHYSKTIHSNICDYENGIYTFITSKLKVKEYPVGLIVRVGVTF